MKAATGEDLAPTEVDRIADRYRVEGLLGRGGMGAVYRVLDEREGRHVALKQLGRVKRDDKQRQLEEMFSREYRTLAELSHPSVIRVFEYGVGEAGPYYTMELLPGGDLHVAAPLPWREACKYLRDVSSSLALLHSRRLIHRDVSPRNVRCHEGRAKLIDFGAMVPMGHGHPIVGTPPHVPPEVLDKQHLDGRCDLYALGATLYWALTRRHAFPARTLGELRDLWRRRPAPPSALAPDVPEALDALVLSLLALEVDARPRSAAEVMERLSTLAGLDDDEHLKVPHAYLTTPALHGRDEPLAKLRAVLAETAKGKSAVAWVTGEAGVGRSRMLDATCVEARLLGARVLRVDATDAQRGECGAGLALLERSFEMPASTAGSGTRRMLLVQDRDDATALTRARMISRVRAVVRRAAGQAPLIVAVDDADGLDPASQALLATLLVAAKRRLLLLLSVRAGAALDPTLEELRHAGETIALSPLAAAETEALLSSVFGDVPGVPMVSARIHALSSGNPHATMELAQHLVDRGKARYELGGWALPTELGEGDLPRGLSDALDARLSKLGSDERELAEVLAVTLEHGGSPEELDAFTSHGCTERRQAALDGLLAAGLVELDGERVAFASTAHRERLLQLTRPERTRAMHRELAAWLRERGRDPIEVARCEQLAGLDGEAIDTLLAEVEQGTRWETAPGDYATILERALDAADQLDRPLRDRFKLRAELVTVGEHMGVSNMREHFAALFAQLRQDGALDAYLGLPEDLPPGERISRAFAVAQERYDALPEHDRVLKPVEGVTALALTARQAGAFGATAMDHQLLMSLPDLSPFANLSPALQTTVENTLPACGHVNAGRYEAASAGYKKTLARLLEPDHGGLDDEFWRWGVNALRFALGQIHAGLGLSTALDYANELEREPTWKVPAWDVRRAFYMRYGDGREADSCRNRMERLALESAQRPPMVDTSARLELDAAYHAGNLTTARRAMERMQPMIALQPGYAPYAHYGPAVYEHLRGDHCQALSHAERALELVAAGEHPSWPWVVNCLLDSLLALERFDEAAERAVGFVAEAEAAGLRIMAHHVTLPLALARARLGHPQEAIGPIEDAIAYREELGCRGLNLGWAYEHRARLAIWMGDGRTFLTAASRCGQEYGKGRGGSSLVAKYEGLRMEARQAGMDTPSMAPPPADTTAYTTVHSTLFQTYLDAGSFEQRCAGALELALRESGADAGVLYRLVGTELEECAASLGDVSRPPVELFTDALGSVCGEDVEDEEDATQTATQSGVRPAGTGGWFPAGLGFYGAHSYRRTGLLLLHFAGEPAPLSRELVELVGRALHVEQA